MFPSRIDMSQKPAADSGGLSWQVACRQQAHTRFAQVSRSAEDLCQRDHRLLLRKEAARCGIESELLRGANNAKKLSANNLFDVNEIACRPFF